MSLRVAKSLRPIDLSCDAGGAGKALCGARGRRIGSACRVIGELTNSACTEVEGAIRGSSS